MGLTLINSETPFDATQCIAVRWASQSECEALLRRMIAGSDTFVRFTLDAAGKQAMSRAFAKVAGQSRDKVTTFKQVAVTANGKTTWKRLKVGESAGNRKTRDAEIRSFTREACVQGEAKVREDNGIAWLEDTLVSSPTTGETVYVLHRQAVTS